MKVFFLPFYKTNNPYQTLLAKHLGELGVQVLSFNGKLRKLPGIVKRDNVDVVHLHWLHPFFVASNGFYSFMRLLQFLFVLVRLKTRGVNVVWTAHNLANHEKKNTYIDWLCNFFVSRLANKIIVHCGNAGVDLRCRYRLLKDKKFLVIPHGHYINAYENQINRKQAREMLSVPSDQVVFLAFGSIKTYKGIPELISAFKDAKLKEALLLVVGRCSNVALDEEITDKVDGHANVRYVNNFINDADVQLYMNTADVVVFPYKEVLTSGAVVLAASFGKACIAPKIGCMIDVLDQGDICLYDTNAAEGLRGALLEAYQSSDRLPTLGARNREFVSRECDWSDIARKTQTIYIQSA